MSEYILWKNEEGEVMVEVVDSSYETILRVQQELTKKGYIIVSICRNCFIDKTFMNIAKGE